MNIVLYKFIKKKNSTKRPDNTVDNIAVTGVLINDSASSVTKFKLSIPDVKQNIARNLNRYNYCYIPAFGRYYWIYDWKYNSSSVWVADMIVDVLASFRNCIINQTTMAYCLRTDNPDYYNNYLVDGSYPTTTHTAIKNITKTTTLFSSNPDNGVFVLGIVSVKPPKYGAMNYYIVPPTQMNTLVANMVSTSPVDYSDEDDWKNSGLTSEILKSMVSPMQYIKSCKWIPVTFSSTIAETEANEIKLGAWPSGAYGKRLDYASQEVNAGYYINLIDIYNETSTADYTYVNKPPFVTFEIFNSLIGSIPLDAVALTNVWQYIVDEGLSYDPLTTHVARVNLKVNLVNGILRWDVQYKDELNVDPNVSFDNIGGLYHDSKNIAVDLPLAEVSYNYIEQAKAGLRTVGAAFDVMGFVKGGAAQYAVNVGENLLDTLNYTYKQTSGSVGAPNGSFFSDINEFQLIVRHTATAPQYPGFFGVPSNQAVLTDTLENYYAALDDVIFNTAVNDIGSAMLKAEYDEIISRLKEGAHLE